MTVEEAIRQVSEELSVDEHVVRRAYYSMFEFIEDRISELPLKERLLSKEELSELKKTFILPKLGKVTVPYGRYNGVWEWWLKRKEKKICIS